MSKYCFNCGNEIQEDENFCSKCGTKNNMTDIASVDTNNATNVNQNMEIKTGDTSAMVCGIVGLFVAGIILGIIAIVQANSSKRKTNGVFTSKARAGFILGIIDIIGAIITICIL